MSFSPPDMNLSSTTLCSFASNSSEVDKTTHYVLAILAVPLLSPGTYIVLAATSCRNNPLRAYTFSVSAPVLQEVPVPSPPQDASTLYTKLILQSSPGSASPLRANAQSEATVIAITDHSRVVEYKISLTAVTMMASVKVSPSTHPELSSHFPPAQVLNQDSGEPSASYSGCAACSYSGTLLALATPTPSILFFSLPSYDHVGTYPTPHTDLITSLIFHPQSPDLMLAAGEDGIVTIYDTRASTPSKALIQTHRPLAAPMPGGIFTFGPEVEWAPGLKAPGGLVALCGVTGSDICCYAAGILVLEIKDARNNDFTRLLQKPDIGVDVDYFIGSEWVTDGRWGDGNEGEDKLVLWGGNFVGNVAAIAVTATGVKKLPTGLLGGHESTVRCLTRIDPSTVITGGEDGRLCVWTRKNPTMPSNGQKRSSKHSKDKSSRHRGQNSHKPY